MADKTAVREAAQAYFCSIADGVGLAKFQQISSSFYDLEKELKKKRQKITYADFVSLFTTKKDKSILESAYKSNYVDAPGVTLNDIEKLFDEKNDWLKSSINIALELMNEIDSIDRDFVKIKSPGWGDLFYVRGDDEIMGTIAKLFKLAKQNQGTNYKSLGNVRFDNINKWSTADIYFGSNDGLKKLKEKLKVKTLDFIELNKLISDLIDSADLLPLSLKFQPGNVTIKKVNFNRSKEEKYLSSLMYVGRNEWAPLYAYDDGKGNITFHYKAADAKTGRNPVSAGKYVAFYFNDKNTIDKNSRIQFRHDPSAGAYKAEVVVGKEARGGSVSGEVVTDIIKLFDASLAAKYNTSLIAGKRQYMQEKRKEIAYHEDPKNNKKMYSKDERSKYPKDKSPYDFKMSQLSNETTGNILNSIMIEFFESPRDQEEKNRRIRKFIEYSTAISVGSSKFVLAK
jgi:hypothetical protein